MTSSALYWSLARGTVPITMSTGTLRLQQGPPSITFNWADRTKIMKMQKSLIFSLLKEIALCRKGLQVSHHYIHKSSFLSFKGIKPLLKDCSKGLLVSHLTGQTRQRSCTHICTHLLPFSFKGTNPLKTSFAQKVKEIKIKTRHRGLLF